MAISGKTEPLLQRLQSYILSQGPEFIAKQLVCMPIVEDTLKSLGLSKRAALIAVKDVDEKDMMAAISGDPEPVLDRLKDFAWIQTQGFLLDQLVDKLMPELLKSSGFQG